MSKFLVLIVTVIVVVVGGIFISQRDSGSPEESNQAAIENEGEAKEKEGDAMEKGDNAMEGDAAEKEGEAMVSESPKATPAPEEAMSPKEFTVTYSDSGFAPSNLRIKLGSKVIFNNDSSRTVWPASAVHPTHRSYPDSGLNKCSTAEEGTLFDACGSVDAGDSWSFVFNNSGSWNYHDHLRPSNNGTIIVE